MTESIALSAQSCTPCRGGVPPLSAGEATDRLSAIPAWALRDDATRLERRFTFEDFAGAFAFVERTSDLAEAEGHHPDISFGWGYAVISLQTHKIKGLHDNDFIMAAKIDRFVP